MCTVTFVPGKNGVLLGSSRDENTGRPPALSPQWHGGGKQQLLFPKDPKGGGTWVAMAGNGYTGILLNGAFVKHEHLPPYARSRGTILPDLFLEDDPVAAFRELALAGVEPFTIVLYGENKLHECRWDGKIRHTRELDVSMAHIWSSATLYDEAMAGERKRWFGEWLAATPDPSLKDLLLFHQKGGRTADPAYAICMQRTGNLRTVSITTISAEKDTATMYYADLLKEETTEFIFHREAAVASSDV